MIRLLIRLFVKNADDIKNPTVRRAYGTMVALVCIVLNVLLFGFKFLVGTLAGSISIRADAVNNLSDAGSSVISLICFKISARPADRDHPFGHARIEYVASMIISFLILLVGVELVRDSIEKLLNPTAVRLELFAIIVLSVSVLCKLWIAFFNHTVGKRVDSEVMRATAADSLSDAIATTAVLLANIATVFLPASVRDYADPAMGVIVAVLIILAGCKVLNETKNSILGEAPNEDVIETIVALVGEYPEVLGIHDMMIHSYGAGFTFASFHAEVDGKNDFYEMHDTIDVIEKRLFTEHRITCTVHMDPIVTGDPLVDEWRERVQQFARGIDTRVRIHDFRMVPGTTHTNLIYDVEIPFELATRDKEIRKQLEEAVLAVDPTYFSVITVDRV